MFNSSSFTYKQTGNTDRTVHSAITRNGQDGPSQAAKRMKNLWRMKVTVPTKTLYIFNAILASIDWVAFSKWFPWGTILENGPHL